MIHGTQQSKRLIIIITLPDGKIYMGNFGELYKVFNIKEGCGIHDIAIGEGIISVIIIDRKFDIVVNRCKELGISKVPQDESNKIEVLKSIVTDLSTVAYIGDDINDFACMSLVKENSGIVGYQTKMLLRKFWN